MAQASNRKALALDLETEAGREALKRPVATADVFVENYRPGAFEAPGLGHEDFARVNPRLIYGSISAFGATAPPRAQTGHDNVQAHDYRGRIFPIDPRAAAIGDRRRYPDARSLPEAPDLGLVPIGANRVIDAVRALAAAGCGERHDLRGARGLFGRRQRPRRRLAERGRGQGALRPLRRAGDARSGRRHPAGSRLRRLLRRSGGGQDPLEGDPAQIRGRRRRAGGGRSLLHAEARAGAGRPPEGTRSSSCPGARACAPAAAWWSWSSPGAPFSRAIHEARSSGHAIECSRRALAGRSGRVGFAVSISVGEQRGIGSMFTIRSECGPGQSPHPSGWRRRGSSPRSPPARSRRTAGSRSADPGRAG